MDTNEQTSLLAKIPAVEGEEGLAQKPLSAAVFVLVEIAMLSNVFLSGFDGTVTVSTYATIGSEFGAANLASWITVSYLLTSTAMQPLYGRFSDVFGRKPCFLVASTTFAFGCLGCGLSGSILCLNLMRALTGVGGGGLMTMATIVNSDIVPPRKRGMYQAVQNLLLGLGAVCGASFGGLLCDAVGWRFCFLLQVPVSALAIAVGQLVLRSPRAPAAAPPPTTTASPGRAIESKGARIWAELDVAGAVLLVLSLLAQVGALSVGGNLLPWSHPAVVGLFAGSLVLSAAFVRVERTTAAAPILAVGMLRRPAAALLLAANFLLGVVMYGLLFALPLIFQAVLLDTPFRAGLRMATACLATPVGSLAAGVAMAKGVPLPPMTNTGMFLLAVGSGLRLVVTGNAAVWSSTALLVVPNLGAGVTFPSSLFQFLGLFEKPDHAVATSTMYATRSVGSVWGVAAVSAIIQDSLARTLPVALKNVPDGREIVEKIRRSMDCVGALCPSVRLAVQAAFSESIDRAIIVLTVCAAAGFVGCWMAARQSERS